MNVITIKGKWNIIKGTLKQQWAQLREDDHLYVEGLRYEALGQIQQCTGKTRDKVKKGIKEVKYHR